MATLSLSQSVNALQDPQSDIITHQDVAFRIEPISARYVEVIRMDTHTSYQACRTQASITAAMDALASECPFCRVELIPLGPQKLYTKAHGWHIREWADCPRCGTSRLIGPRRAYQKQEIA